MNQALLPIYKSNILLDQDYFSMSKQPTEQTQKTPFLAQQEKYRNSQSHKKQPSMQLSNNPYQPNKSNILLSPGLRSGSQKPTAAATPALSGYDEKP